MTGVVCVYLSAIVIINSIYCDNYSLHVPQPDLKSSRYEDISQGLRSNRVIHRLVVACPKMALTNVAKGVLDGVGLSVDLPLRFLHLHLGEALPENNLGGLKGHRKLESYIVCPPR